MKTYEEMTRSVLKRVKEYRQRRRKRILLSVTAGAMFATVLVAVAIAERNVPKNDKFEHRLVVMCAAAEYEEQTKLSANMEKPLKFLIRVRDIRDVKQYADYVDILAEEAAFREDIWSEQTDDDLQTNNQYTRWGDENAIISLIYKGFLYLKLDDYDQIQDISVYTMDAGVATVSDYTVQDEDIQENGIGINWSLSDATVEKLCKDPQMPLSDIHDTIRVRVQFKDGLVEITVIELSVDDEGQIYVKLQGTITDK